MEKASILIVEDDSVTSYYISQLLTTYGYDVAGSARTGHQAIDMALASGPDLILMDIILDGDMTGIEAAVEIRRHADIPVIYLTANADELTVLQARDTAPFGYVIKPIQGEDLFTNIDSAIQKHALMKKLHESEARYRSLVENALEGIFVVGGRGMLFANPRLSEITGYSIDEMNGIPPSRVIHEQDYGMVMDNNRRRLAGEHMPESYQIRIRHKSGETRWVELHAVLIRWEGAPAVLAFANDITDRKVADDRLLRFASDLGQRVKELRCMYQVSKLLSEKSLATDELFVRLLECVPEAMQYPEITCARLRYDGAEYVTGGFVETPWSIMCNILVAGARRGTISVHYREQRPERGFGPFLCEEMDLLIELALHLSHFLELRGLEEKSELLSLVVESSDDAIIAESLGGIAWSWNRGAESMYGYSAEEVLGRPVMVIVPPEMRDEFHDILRRIARGERIDHYETVRRRKDGRLLDVSLTISPIVDRKGVIIGASAIARDITGQKALEKNIIDSGLHERLQLGHALHDSLGQILTGAAFMSEALRKMLAEKDPDASGRAAEIQSLINEAIGLTRTISRGLVPVDLSGNSLEDALRELADTSHRMYSIRCALDVEKGFSMEDPASATHLYYIAQEALRNAVSHGRARRVDIILRKNSERLALIVRDDGHGLKKDPDSAEGIGVKIMRYRARFIGGRMSIVPRHEGGVLVMCTVPLLSRAADCHDKIGEIPD